MERWRALVPLMIARERVEPGEVFEASVLDASAAVRLRLAEPAPAAKAQPKPRPRR